MDIDPCLGMGRHRKLVEWIGIHQNRGHLIRVVLVSPGGVKLCVEDAEDAVVSQMEGNDIIRAECFFCHSYATAESRLE